MAARFKWFVPEDYAYSHGPSADAFVDARWRELEQWLESDVIHLKEELLPLFHEAAKHPELRQLSWRNIAILLIDPCGGR